MLACTEALFVLPFTCRILDVQPNHLSVGGVRSIEPVLQRRGQIATHDFVGCIMEFAVNGRPLEPSQALASHGILDRSAKLHPSLPPSCLSHLSVFPNLLEARCGISVQTFCSKKTVFFWCKRQDFDSREHIAEFPRIFIHFLVNSEASRDLLIC